MEYGKNRRRTIKQVCLCDYTLVCLFAIKKYFRFVNMLWQGWQIGSGIRKSGIEHSYLVEICIEDQGHRQWGCGHWGPKALQFVGHSQTETGKSTRYAEHVRCSSIIVAIIYLSFLGWGVSDVIFVKVKSFSPSFKQP